MTKATFEKWQHEHERDLSWLRCELERDKRYVRGFSLLRAVCKKYKSNLKNFWRAWTSGSTNQKVSTVLDHATSAVHKAEMARLRAHRAKASGGSAVLTSTIGRSLSTLDHDTRSQMERKFDLCFVMAKQSIDIPVAKYPALEERHAVDVGHAYGTPSSASLSLASFSVRASLIHIPAEAISLGCQ